VKHEIRYNKHSACHDRRFDRDPMKGARSQRRSLFVCAGIQSGGDVRRWCGSILCHSHHHSSQCVQAWTSAVPYRERLPRRQQLSLAT